jgi:hypothetical protein
MQFTEYKDFKLTEQKAVTFVLGNCNVDNVAGDACIGFSGSYYDPTYQTNVPSAVSFKFKKGKLYDFEDRYVYSYVPGQNLEISGTLSGTQYNYYINGEKICNVGSKTDFAISHLYADASNCNLNASPTIYSEGYGVSVDFPLTTVRESLLTGVVSNTSTESKLIISDVEMKGSTSRYYSMESFPDTISAGSTGNIVLKSLPGGEKNLPLALGIKSNVGDIYHIGTVKASEKPLINVSSYLFTASANPFDLRSSSDDNTAGEFYYTSSILSGAQYLSSNVNISLEYEGGSAGDYYNVTGVNVTNQGNGYDGDATVVFSNGEVTASGDAVMQDGKVVDVNITNSGIYFVSIPEVTFTGNVTGSNPYQATGTCSVYNWKKTFAGTWGLETGKADGMYKDYLSNQLTGSYGDAFYPPDLGLGIYEDSNAATIYNNESIFIRVTNKKTRNTINDQAKLKITNGHDTQTAIITGGKN